MSDAQRTPDALYLPRADGRDLYERAERTTALARKLMNMPDGPPPVISPNEQRDGKLVHFVRRTHADTLLFPTNHPRAGEPRYDWTDGPDGAKLGFLKGD